MSYKIIIDVSYLIFLFVSFFYWKKSREKGWLWFSWIFTIAILGDILDFLIKNILQASPEIRLFSSIFFIVFGLLLIVSILVTLLKGFNPNVSFKKDRSLKEFRQAINGFPQFLYINPNFKKFTEKHKYPYFFSIQIEITKKDSQGLPQGKEEIENIDDLEDSIDKKIKSMCEVYFIGRVTRNGFRYLYYYISKDIDAETAFKPHDSSDPKSRLYYSSLEKDENWEIAAKYFKVII